MRYLISKHGEEDGEDAGVVVDCEQWSMNIITLRAGTEHWILSMFGNPPGGDSPGGGREARKSATSINEESVSLLTPNIVSFYLLKSLFLSYFMTKSFYYLIADSFFCFIIIY